MNHLLKVAHPGHHQFTDPFIIEPFVVDGFDLSQFVLQASHPRFALPDRRQHGFGRQALRNHRHEIIQLALELGELLAYLAGALAGLAFQSFRQDLVGPLDDELNRVRREHGSIEGIEHLPVQMLHPRLVVIGADPRAAVAVERTAVIKHLLPLAGDARASAQDHDVGATALATEQTAQQVGGFPFGHRPPVGATTGPFQIERLGPWPGAPQPAPTVPDR